MVASGQKLPEDLIVALIDDEGQILETDSESVIEIKI